MAELVSQIDKLQSKGKRKLLRQNLKMVDNHPFKQFITIFSVRFLPAKASFVHALGGMLLQDKRNYQFSQIASPALMLLHKNQLQSIRNGRFVIFDSLNALYEHLCLLVSVVFAMELIKEKSEHDEQKIEILTDEISRKNYKQSS